MVFWILVFYAFGSFPAFKNFQTRVTSCHICREVKSPSESCCPEWYTTDIALEIYNLKVKQYANVLSLNYSFLFRAKHYVSPDLKSNPVHPKTGVS
jgi:hypothetical protein